MSKPKNVDKEILKQTMSKAAKDPLFLQDLNASMKDFEVVDKESIQRDYES